jgi:hypothetical protein
MQVIPRQPEEHASERATAGSVCGGHTTSRFDHPGLGQQLVSELPATEPQQAPKLPDGFGPRLAEGLGQRGDGRGQGGLPVTIYCLVRHARITKVSHPA